MIQSDPSTERYTFAVSLWTRGIMLFGGLMFLAFAGFSLRSDTPAAAWVCLLFGLPSLALFVGLSRSVFISQAGIGTRWFGKEQFVRWENLGAVRVRSNGALVLVSADQMTMIKASEVLNGYGALVEIIRQMRPDLWKIVTRSVFHAGVTLWAAAILMLVTPLGMGIAFLVSANGQRDSILAGLFFLLVSAVSAGLFAQVPHTIRLEKDVLLVKALAGARRINRAEIISITLGEVGSANGVPYQGVTVQFHDARRNKPRIYRFVSIHEGIPHLYASLMDWWGGAAE